MRAFLVPRSRSGWWAAVLGVLFIALLAGKMAGLVPILSFAIAGLGLVAMGVAIDAIVRRRERSLWAFLAVAGGVLVIAFMLGELIGPPH